MQEKFRLQSKELKDAIGQRKLAMTEYTEVSDKYVLFYYFLFYLLSCQNLPGFAAFF